MATNANLNVSELLLAILQMVLEMIGAGQKDKDGNPVPWTISVKSGKDSKTECKVFWTCTDLLTFSPRAIATLIYEGLKVRGRNAVFSELTSMLTNADDNKRLADSYRAKAKKRGIPEAEVEADIIEYGWSAEPYTNKDLTEKFLKLDRVDEPATDGTPTPEAAAPEATPEQPKGKSKGKQ